MPGLSLVLGMGLNRNKGVPALLVINGVLGILLLGADGQALQGADGQYLYGVA
jgi:hypothetical protein